MRSTRTALLMAAMLAAGPASLTAQEATAPKARPAETKAQRDSRMQWWREARFGMFVHYGLYSGLAGTWDGKAVGTSGGMEWIQQYVKLDTDTYAKAAVPRFQPAKDFAREWARLAKAAGCQYLVFTTKHHDGFALHDSKVSDFDAGSVLQRDLVDEITRAAHEEGLKVGYYHSVIDWHHPQYEYGLSAQLPHPLKGKPYPEGKRDHAKYQEFLFAQVGELLERKPDLIWWDFSSIDFQGDAAWRASDLMALARARLPGVIQNNRLYRSREAGWASMGTDGYLPQLDPKYGDFITPEQHIPATGMPGVDWETCMTMNTTWGYSEHDHAWKSARELVQNLVDIASKGGNYLLNIGPKADGSVPQQSVDGLRAIGAWMERNAESIRGTQASPFEQLTFGRCTRKQLEGGVTRLYLHVFAAPKDGVLLLPGLRNEVKACQLLAGDEALRAERTAAGVTVAFPTKVDEEMPVVVVLDVAGAPKVEGSAR